MMKNIIATLIITIFISGCSTMVSPTKTSVYIKSKKNGQPFIIKDSDGKIIAKAITPAVIKLDNKGNSTYTYLTQCEIKKEESEMNEWVLGNIVMVSITGLLIDIGSGYSNEPVEKVSLLNCDKVIAEKKYKIARKKHCGKFVSQYDRSVHNFNNYKNKGSIYKLKHTQDYLLKYCSEYVDVSLYKNQSEKVNKVYGNYL